MLDQARLYLKHLAVGTPLETPLKAVQYRLDRRRRCRTPGLAQLAEEDRWIDQVITRHVTPGMRCLDVGAHLGSLAGQFRKLTDPSCVAAVEPDPQKAGWLRRKYPDITVHQTALSDAPGEATFFVPLKKRGFSGLTKPKDADTGDVREFTTPLNTIDALVPADQPLGLIKMDIEGAELAALRGAKETIARCRPLLIFECTRAGMTRFGYDSAAMWALLTEELGYDIFYLDDYLAGRAATTFEGFCEAHTFPWRAYNFVAKPRAHQSVAQPGTGNRKPETGNRAA